MTRCSASHRAGTSLAIFCAVTLLCAACLPTIGSAQSSKKKGADHEKKTGTVAEVEKKGKNATLTIEQSDGEKFEVQINPKANFVVKGKGDISFFKHGNMHVSSDEVVRNAANNYLHGRKFTLYLGGKGPGDRVEADPNNAEVCRIAGTVVDADDESFTFEAEGSPYKVGFDQGGIDISVESTEPEHAAAGAAVEVEGTTRSGKFIPSSIVVTLEKPMSASEVFAGHDKKSKSKTASKTTSKKTSAKNDKSDKDKAGGDKGDDSTTGDKKPGNADPFGVLGGDSGSKKDSKKPAKPAPKKKSTDGDMN